MNMKGISKMKDLLLYILLSIVVFSSPYDDVSSYEITNGKVYYIENDFRGEIKGADIKTFKVLNSLFSKDKKHVYYMEYIIEGANPESYILLLSSYGKDKDSVYHGTRKLEGTNPETFTPLGIFYGKDGNSVYSFSKKLIDLDPKTFEVLDDIYAKDKKNIYFMGIKMLNSNPQSFKVYDKIQVISGGFAYEAEDKNNYYKDGKIVKKK